MQIPSGRRCTALAIGLCLGAVASGGIMPAAWAQFAGANGSAVPGAGSIATGQHGGGAAPKPVVPEPDAVPGARARAPVAPASKGMGDMQPNDALFDAINRGDIVAARDALSRGADLGAVNVLGMTPLELSVDLGRNDISFLLLSMRGEDSGRGSRAVARTGAQPAAAEQAPAEKTVARRGRGGTPAAQPVAVIKPVQPPKLFANDGGTPLPSAGFLGFGSRSAAN